MVPTRYRQYVENGESRLPRRDLEVPEMDAAPPGQRKLDSQRRHQRYAPLPRDPSPRDERPRLGRIEARRLRKLRKETSAAQLVLLPIVRKWQSGRCCVVWVEGLRGYFTINER